MSSKTAVATVGTATIAAVLLGLLGVLAVNRPLTGHPDDAGIDHPIAIAGQPVRLLVQLGIGAEKQAPWNGSVSVSPGRVLGIRVVRAARNATIEANTFRVKPARVAVKQPAKGTKKNQSRKKTKGKSKSGSATGAAKGNKTASPSFRLVSAILAIDLDAPDSASVEIDTAQGRFSFVLGTLSEGQTKTFLDGQASVERQPAAIRLPSPTTEDDHPTAARGPDGTIWAAYVAYRSGGPIIMEQVAQGRFDSLVPKNHGDQIRLLHFDGKQLSPVGAVTPPRRDVWKPAIAVDGSGTVHVVWAEKRDGDWDLFTRAYTPGKDGKGSWSEERRVTNTPGNDFNVVATTDSDGRVWIAWQAWRGNGRDASLRVLWRRLGSDRTGMNPEPRGNAWWPAIAADSNGTVYVAWDEYDENGDSGSYDVRLATIRNDRVQTRWITRGSTYAARPSLACDPQDRLWIAYEEGDANWGKDYQGSTPEKVGIRNLGAGLYVRRTVRVRCLVDGELKRTEADLQDTLATRLKRNRSIPRLAIDQDGGVWLFFRHHPLANGGGETWHSYYTRFDGKSWSPPRQLANSSNLLDNRPALVPYRDGLFVLHSSDSRQRTQNRDQDDLFVSILGDGDTAPPRLQDAPATEADAAPPVHPGEPQTVAKLRDFRLTIGGRELRLVRGEFHRHTEYTAHRDQDGTLEDSLRYGIDAGRLDWMGNGDHDNGFGSEYMWWQIQKIFDLHHHPPRFVAAMTYERSVRFPSGHRNVMFPVRGIRPLPRLSNKQELLYGTPEEGAPDIKLLYRYLKHFDSICAVHTSGTNMGTDWRDNDPLVEPIVEIYQGHRHNYERLDAPRAATKATQIGGFQPSGYINNALEKGYRLGFQSSSDHVSTHMSYACVWVEDNSRQGIIDAFKKRHCYGATDNILLVVTSGEHLMGDEFMTDQPPSLTVHVEGTAPIAKVHVIRNNRYVYTAEPGKRVVDLTFTDADPLPGQTAYYYVRVEQADTNRNLAWASPMWIRYQP
ncbi:MAG: hypothetical protein D6725_05790 [Planctomycetota bacterium]|nr:MAG: hypothetical protein D6725_05790 [Planctomycetota bacterium]